MAKNAYKPVNRYLVTWTIDIEATSPKKAAEKALAIQRNPSSIATVFDVCEHQTDKTETIDLYLEENE